MLAGSLSEEDEEAVRAELDAITLVRSSLSKQKLIVNRLFFLFFFYWPKRSDFSCFKGWRRWASWSAHWAPASSGRAKDGCESTDQMQRLLKTASMGLLLPLFNSALVLFLERKAAQVKQDGEILLA